MIFQKSKKRKNKSEKKLKSPKSKSEKKLKIVKRYFKILQKKAKKRAEKNNLH